MMIFLQLVKITDTVNIYYFSSITFFHQGAIFFHEFQCNVCLYFIINSERIDGFGGVTTLYA